MRLSRVREILEQAELGVPMNARDEWLSLAESMEHEPIEVGGQVIGVLSWERIHAGLFMHIVIEPAFHGRWLTRGLMQKHLAPRLAKEPVMIVVTKPVYADYLERLGCIQVSVEGICQLWVMPMRRG